MNISHMLWIDLEMTGLDPDQERIIEIAAILTDSKLKVLDQVGPMVIHQNDELLDNMDEWNTKHHGQSGLTDQVRASKFNEASGEKLILDLLDNFNVENKKAILCGNSIWQDRRFMERYMPNILDRLHYRLLDVSSIKLVKELWYPKLPYFEKPKEAHRALDDIKESLREMRYYQENLFIPVLTHKKR